MKPTIENWQTNPLEVGPIYPWVGLEVLMVAVALLFCLYFLFWKLTSESRHYSQTAKQLTVAAPADVRVRFKCSTAAVLTVSVPSVTSARMVPLPLMMGCARAAPALMSNATASSRLGTGGSFFGL